MHDYTAPGWRQTIDRHYAALAEDLTSQLESEIGSAVLAERERAVAQVEAAVLAERERSVAEVEAAVSAEREKGITAASRAVAEESARAASEADNIANHARRRFAESLNQTLRRIRQTTAEHETLQLLLEESALSAERVVVLLIESNQARIALWRGAALRGDEEEATPIDLCEAAAIASCVESRDPVVALAVPAEVSPILAEALDSSGAGKVYLFPITARLNTIAVMMACGEVTAAPIELLCEAAGMKLESFESHVAAATEAKTLNASLVQIASASDGVPPRQATRSPAPQEQDTWTALTPEDQALHLRAQRSARVRVAQIRISESEALRKGAQAGNVYGALRSSIDAARAEYEQTYMSQSPSMVDYLHLEVVRSLAHQDERVLGQDYPGPIA